MKFTIAIPTRNRSSFLPCALKSALNQDYEDYEILVSNNNSDDDTESVILQYSDPKIRYIKTERSMSMVDHWNFVFDHVKGDWVLYLCDDDALSSFTLPVVGQTITAYPEIKIFQIYNKSHYAYSHVNELRKNKSIRNCIVYHPPSRQEIEIFDAAKTLKRTYKNLDMDYPKPHNSFVRRSFLEEIKSKYKNIFHNWAPDITSGILFLANIRKYAHINKPLLICGRNYKSFGAGALVNPGKILEYRAEYGQFDDFYNYSPFPQVIVLSNGLHDTYCLMRDILGYQQKDLEINPYIFRKRLLLDIKTYLDNGYEEYRQHYDQVSDDIRKYKKPFSETLLGQLAKRAKGIVPRLKNGRARLISGDNPDQPFTDIYEATLYINKLFQQKVK